MPALCSSPTFIFENPCDRPVISGFQAVIAGMVDAGQTVPVHAGSPEDLGRLCSHLVTASKDGEENFPKTYF